MQIRNKKTLVALILIIIVGIFFRTYNFSDYLRFNPDQARDATLVRDVLVGKENWPDLGPQAGGTDFKLGPIFYHVQIVSTKLFGSAPEKLAYPDLFLSILSIPLLYFFLRKYFSRKITLASVAILAVSFYAIKYARFAWNPNSIPFYVLLFLYSLHELSSPDSKRKWLWASLIGLSAGIGVQLHSLLLFSFPIVFVVYFTYLFFKKNGAWKFVPLIIIIALIFNTAQIMSEVKTGGKNFQAFTKGLENKSAREGTLAYKFALNAVCHVQVNSFMIFPVGSNSECDFIDAAKNFEKNKFLIFHIAFATVFFLGGYFLLFRYFWRETDTNKKNFLGLILIYSGVLFVILIPLAAEISFRFFLVLEFMPFLLLAFWLKFLGEKFPKLEASIEASILISLLAINIFMVSRQFSYLAGNAKEGRNGFEEITLGEVNFMADFIASHSATAEKIYIDGKAGELFKITKPIKYFTDKSGLDVKEFGKKDILGENDKLFLIDVIKNPASTEELPEKNLEKYNVLDEGKYRRINIYEIKNK